VRRRRSERGEVFTAFVLLGFWVVAVFTGAFTHAIVASHYERERKDQVCYPDPAAATRQDLEPRIDR
jgi:hypothetical protein